MQTMILGLILFIAVHSVRIFAPAKRELWITKFGEGTYKGLIALLSLVGFFIITQGYPDALASMTWGWSPSQYNRHLTVLLMLMAFVFAISAYVPHNHIKEKLKHPLVLSVKVWALAHLIANGQGANIVLFGSLLIWAVLSFRAARKRDRMVLEHDHHTEPKHSTKSAARIGSTILCVLLGLVVWAAFVAYLHNMLFGVYPIIIPGLIGPTLMPS